MKKLITIMAAAVSALFAFGDGDGFISGTSFESYDMGEKTVSALTDFEDDGVGTGGSRYWYYEGDKTVVLGVITNGAPNAPVAVTNRPNHFASDTNVQYLDLANTDASNVLYRAISSVAGKSNVANFDGQSIGTDGLYLDTLVKFTPADSTNDFVLASGDKLAITYIEETEDEDGDGVCLSNIVVRAGYVANGVATEKTYIMELPADLRESFVATNWHRLTVRAIADVGYAAAPVGFVVYIDGCKDPLTYATDEVAGDQDYTNALAGNAIVNRFLYNSTIHALLPSAVNSGTAKATLAAVGFKGSGCVDDISFVSGTPTFVKEGTAVTIAWDENVASYTVIAGETTIVDHEAVSGAGSTNLLLTGITAITVTATYGEGYEAGALDVTAGTLNNGEWTFENGATLTINSMFPLFDVGGVHYGSFGAALDAAVDASTSSGSPATIKLLSDFAGTASEPALMFSAGNIVLDLNGKTIQGLDSDYSVANTGASLTIIDSASGGIVAVPQMSDQEQSAIGSLFVYGDTAITEIRAGIFEGVVTVTTSEVLPTAVLTVYGGKFYDADYDETDEQSVFYLVAYAGEYNFLPEGVTYNYDGSNYFTVSASTPTTFALTTTGGENAEIETDPADVSTLTEATNVTITATATNGFTYARVDLTGTDWNYDSTADAISMTTNISENTEVAVPNAVEKQSSEGWPEGQDLDDVAGKAAGDQFPGITNALATADAKAVATWAEAKGVAYADKGGILPEAFLLDCANTQAAIDEAAEDFKINAITIVGDTVTIDPADGAVYGNGQIVIEGATSLASPISWHEKAAGDHFFRATLVVKPVTP